MAFVGCVHRHVGGRYRIICDEHTLEGWHTVLPKTAITNHPTPHELLVAKHVLDCKPDASSARLFDWAMGPGGRSSLSIAFRPMR